MPRKIGNSSYLLMAWLGASFVVVTGCNPQQAENLGKIVVPHQEPPPPRPIEPPAPRDVWPPRAVWVVRRAYNSPEEIAGLMEACRQAGFNTVLFQVRGTATVHYRSAIEPMAYEYRSPPTFDPLEVACREAHRRGLALHAWVNMMPAWHGPTPPTDPRHVYNTHPEWFWYDQAGRRQPLGNCYVSLNPCLPEVRAYIVSILEEIVRKYPVDGLHLDYVRFPTEGSPRKSEYPYDRNTLALYRQATGQRPRDNRARWSSWRTQQVTQLVMDARSMVTRVRPGVKLTAACGHDMNAWRKDYFQDGPTWVRNGYVDLIFVMNYTNNTAAFAQRQAAWRRAAGGYPVAAGIGLDQHRSPAISIEQIRMAQQWGQGWSLFSSNLLFDGSPQSRYRLEQIRPALLATMPRAPT